MVQPHSAAPTGTCREIHSISVRENVCVCMCMGIGVCVHVWVHVCVRVIGGFEVRAPLASG